MPLLLLSLALLLCPALAMAAEPASEPEPDLRLNPWTDAPVALFSGAYTFATMFGGESPWVEQNPPGEPELGLDARYAGLSEIDGEGPDLLSDITGIYPSYALPLVLGAYGLLRTADSGRARLARSGTYAVVGLEAITISQNITHLVKHAVRRPRPFAYSEEWRAAYDEAVANDQPVDCEAQLSFPSGHTSTAGAWSFALAHTLGITQDWAWQLEALPYLGAAGITVWTGALRVRAHKHFPTDVMVGGLLGAGVGILVPELHRSERLVVSSAVSTDGTPMMGLSAAW